MATKNRNNRRRKRGGKAVLAVFLSLALLIAAVVGFAFLNASVVRLRRAEVPVSDLPPAFEGMTILYLTDFDLCGTNTAAKSAKLLETLQAARPDALVLGGDYTSPSLFDILNSSDGQAEQAASRLKEREKLIGSVAGFSAPMGKYALCAPDDPDPAGLADLMRRAGVTPLFGDAPCGAVRLERAGQVIYLCGACADNANLYSLGETYKNGDCVLLAAYSPEIIPRLMTTEAYDHGRWADLVLAGHTHGGQIRLFGRNALQLTALEQQYLCGWYVENNLPMLVSGGVGCEGINLRIGTAPEAWLIELKRG